MDDDIRAALDRGESVRCPSCDRTAHRKEYCVNRAMADFVVRLVLHNDIHPGEFLHLRRVFELDDRCQKASTDGAYFVQFGVVERQGAGRYRVTPLGYSWAKGHTTIPARFWVYNGIIEEYSVETITCAQAFERDVPSLPDALRPGPQLGLL